VDQQQSRSDHTRLVRTVSRLTKPASATRASSKDTNSANKLKPACTPREIQEIREMAQVLDDLRLKDQKASKLGRAAPLFEENSRIYEMAEIPSIEVWEVGRDGGEI
jgi:hypothetical protein